MHRGVWWRSTSPLSSRWRSGYGPGCGIPVRQNPHRRSSLPVGTCISATIRPGAGPGPCPVAATAAHGRGCPPDRGAGIPRLTAPPVCLPPSLFVPASRNPVVRDRLPRQSGRHRPPRAMHFQVLQYHRRMAHVSVCRVLRILTLLVSLHVVPFGSG